MVCRRARQHSEDEDDAARRDREGDGPLAERQVKRLAALRSRFLPVVLQFGSRSRTQRGTMGRQALTFGFACRFGFPSAPEHQIQRAVPAVAGMCAAHCRDRASMGRGGDPVGRSEEHTSELQSLMRISYAVFCLKKKINLTYTFQNEKKQNKKPKPKSTQ